MRRRLVGCWVLVWPWRHRYPGRWLIQWDSNLRAHGPQHSRPVSRRRARLVDQIDAHLTKAIELGFLRRTKDKEPSFEVRRIVKAFVDAQWLADFDARLSEYAAELSPDAEGAA